MGGLVVHFGLSFGRRIFPGQFYFCVASSRQLQPTLQQAESDEFDFRSTVRTGELVRAPQTPAREVGKGGFHP